jgi:hypothetical protein
MTTPNGDTAEDAISPTATTSNEIPNSEYVARVSIKPPEFYRRNPTVWFKQIESQFALANLTRSQTKFHHVMGALPEDVACYLPDDITTYETLKEQVLQTYQKTRQELLEEALGTITLDGQKPSVCLARIKRKLADCGLTPDEEVVRHRLLQAMPHQIRLTLSAHTNLGLSEFAKVADTIYGYQQDNFTVAAIGQPSTSKYQAARNFHQEEGNSNYGSIQPFSAGQKPKLCRFHVYYADKAKRCKPWCKWPGRKPQITDPSSRASSPAPQARSQQENH